MHRRQRCERSIARAVSRGLAATLVMAVVAGFMAYKYWTDPVTVRRLVLEGLRRQFPGADVSLDSARIWPGWGIQVTNLSLARKDDPSLTPVVQVPEGRIEHDPDALKEGRLRIRRFKLDRPRLTAICRADGKWNFDGLLAPPKPGVPLPIIVVERGTVVVRIATPRSGESVWELGQIRASIMEHPGALARFEGRGSAPRVGSLAIEGTWKRCDDLLSAALDLSGMPINLELLGELARFMPVPTDHIRFIGGKARVQLELRRNMDQSPAWQADWRIHVDQGCVGLRDLPIDLTAIQLGARLRNGLITIEHVQALAADAPVRATAELRLSGDNPPECLQNLSISVDRLLVTPELFARLPEAAKRFQQRFAPVGRLSVDFTFGRAAAGGSKARLQLQANEMSARYHKFPYPLRRVGGAIVTEFVDGEPIRHDVDVTAEINGGARAAVRGIVSGAEPHPAVDLWITGVGSGSGNEIPVDEDLISALPPRFQPLARSFHMRGKCSVAARLHRNEGNPHGHDQFHVRCRDAAICYDGFPIPLETVAAELEIHLGPGMPNDPNPGDHWILRRCNGKNGNGDVTIAAWNTRHENSPIIVIDCTGIGLPLTDTLKAALNKYRLSSTWDLLAPSGKVDCSSRVILRDSAEGAKEPSVALALRGANIAPAFFPYALSDVQVQLHAVPGRVLLRDFKGRHGATSLRFAGAEIRTDQGLRVDVRELNAGPLASDPELLSALPAGWQKAATVLQPNGEFAVELSRLLYHDPPAVPGPPGPPTLHWDGVVRLNNAGWNTGVAWNGVYGVAAVRGAVRGNRLDWLTGHSVLDRANVLRQPLEKLHAQFVVESEMPDVLQIREVTGKLFGGNIAAEARVAFGGGLDYSADVKALGIRMEEFGAANQIGGKLEGRATAQVYLSGHGAGLDELTGRGDVDVPAGKLYDLPLALELIKAISLRAPDGVAFDEAHASFKIEGRRLKVERLDLLGSAVSLGGHGALNLDGTGLDLDFCAVWARIVQVLPVGWREVPPWVSQQFLKIRMGGSLNEPTFVPEPVPFLTEPVKRLLERTNRKNSNAG